MGNEVGNEGRNEVGNEGRNEVGNEGYTWLQYTQHEL